MTKPLVAYYRVSTQRQARSGLGLEAQQAAVAEHTRHTGAQLLAEYVETESGKKCQRPELERAIAHAKRTGATLVVAKLDRLARNVAFTAALMESGVDFLCCDNPSANRLTIHILAAVAEDEARRISERTKAALAAAKARGVKLGASNPRCRNLTPEARRRGTRASSKTSRERASIDPAIRAVIAELQPHLGNTHIAEVLNQRGYRTARGNRWTDVAVRRVRASSGSVRP